MRNILRNLEQRLSRLLQMLLVRLTLINAMHHTKTTAIINAIILCRRNYLNVTQDLFVCVFL